MQVKTLIVAQLKKALLTVCGMDVAVQVGFPSALSFGDYSSNVAMQVFGKLRQGTGDRRQETRNTGQTFGSPMELAEAIRQELLRPSGGSGSDGSQELRVIQKVDVVAPGFLNFWVTDEVLGEKLFALAQKKDVLQHSSKSLRNKRIMVEFTDPNPFKEFHIGHLYNNIVGEALCRLFEAEGAIIKRVTYQGDVGLHVAKAIWGMKQKLAMTMADLTLSILEKKSLRERSKFLGEAYALGAKAYEEDEQAKKEIVMINKQVYEQSDEGINTLYDVGKAWSLEYFDHIYKRLGTKFDKHYFESVAGPIGMRLVKEHMQDGTFVESEGAIVFPKEKSGLHTRVFINSQGLPTYEAKELGLAPTKYGDFPYDESIIITGNEINEYFKVLLKALSLIDPELAAKTKHLSHGMVRVPGGKMSSRLGNVLTGEWLLDHTKEKILAQYPEMDMITAEKVAISAVKYALLRSGLGKDVEFSFEESISFEGNSGPYLQYTYARTQSVLRKVQPSESEIRTIQSVDLQKEELDLLRLLLRFDDMVVESAERYAPSVLCGYLFELAQLFNLFYQKCSILHASDSVRDLRLDLTAGVGQVLLVGLSLLGIDAPERM
jgi:arginyl-tRNA synthetase